MNLSSHRRSLGAIVAATITIAAPAAIAMTYDDFGDLFKNAVNGLAGDRPPETRYPDVPNNAPLTHGAKPYSSFGSLTAGQVDALHNLAWPQSTKAMRSRFGAPSYISADLDWFEQPDGEFIAVRYQGAQAVGVEAGK